MTYLWTYTLLSTEATTDEMSAHMREDIDLKAYVGAAWELLAVFTLGCCVWVVTRCVPR